jgi:hypothetical protein
MPRFPTKTRSDPLRMPLLRPSPHRSTSCILFNPKVTTVLRRFSACPKTPSVRSSKTSKRGQKWSQSTPRPLTHTIHMTKTSCNTTTVQEMVGDHSLLILFLFCLKVSAHEVILFLFCLKVSAHEDASGDISSPCGPRFSNRDRLCQKCVVCVGRKL